ncbi:MAG: hypothetical protein JRF63_13000 [Deltaproteobacteria bacterium]|nr:hypothetical protein [Deltaproteobacteria bacterium]
MRRISIPLLLPWMLALVAFAVWACGDSSMADKASGGADSDSDSDSDADTDVDTDADTDGDSDGDTDPPEEEEPPNYKVPKGSGRYVFIADENHDAVVIIDWGATSSSPTRTTTRW